MKYAKPVLAVLALALFVSASGAQDSGLSCKERVQELEREAQDAVEDADTRKEREEEEERYTELIQEAQKDCQQDETGFEDVEQKELTDDCRDRALDLRQEFIEDLKNTPVTEQNQEVGEFMSETSSILASCNALPRDSIDYKGPDEDRNYNLSVDLPEKTPDKCRSEIQELRDKYSERLREAPEGEKQNVADEFFSTVEKELESCNQDFLREKEDGTGLDLVNVSEAPAEIPESCKQRFRELNKEIRQQVNETGNSSAVKQQYKGEYKSAIQSCMTSKVTQDITSKIASSVAGLIGGKSTSSAQPAQETKIERQQQKINQLQQRVDELENTVEKLRSEENQQTGSQEDNTESNNQDENISQTDREEQTRETGEEDQTRREDGNRPSNSQAGIVQNIIGSLF